MAAGGQFTDELEEARREEEEVGFELEETSSSPTATASTTEDRRPASGSSIPAPIEQAMFSSTKNPRPSLRGGLTQQASWTEQQQTTNQEASTGQLLPVQLAHSPLLDAERLKPLSKLEVLQELQKLGE